MEQPKLILVPEGSTDNDAIIKFCPECKTQVWFVPQTRMYFSRAGARKLRFWGCETHPLPDTLNEE